MPALCRDCEHWFDAGGHCPKCQSPRVVQHDELEELSIAHMDCDAFFASVEKRDRPELRDKPVIVGGGRRGVVSTACYIARLSGVHSAMPMFQALNLCPDAVVVYPRMRAYVEVSKQIRALMDELTPMVEPLSVDEAFLNMSGTSRLHHAPPAVLLARLANRMEREIGVSGSIGLSHNKFLAKIASDLDKPRGFSVIGKAETQEFLFDKPVGLIWGVGPVQQRRLNKAGIYTLGDLRNWLPDELAKHFGRSGPRLWRLAHGQDTRRFSTHSPVRSMSNETTFSEDISDLAVLDGYIWRLSEKVAGRAKAKQEAGRVVTLKLKQSDFKLISRRKSLSQPVQLAEQIYQTARELLESEKHKSPFRLIGVGISEVNSFMLDETAAAALDAELQKKVKVERTADEIRERFGADAIIKGRALR